MRDDLYMQAPACAAGAASARRRPVVLVASLLALSLSTLAEDTPRPAVVSDDEARAAGLMGVAQSSRAM